MNLLFRFWIWLASKIWGHVVMTKSDDGETVRGMLFTNDEALAKEYMDKIIQ